MDASSIITQVSRDDEQLNYIPQSDKGLFMKALDCCFYYKAFTSLNNNLCVSLSCIVVCETKLKFLITRYTKAFRLPTYG